MSKNIVIIGASAAGANTAKQLAAQLPLSHRVILIDQNEFAYWPIGALRAAVVPGFEDSVVSDIAESIFPAKSNHLLIKGIQVVSLGTAKVVLESGTKEFPDGSIPAETIVLAMGSTYAFPCRPASKTIKGTKSALQDLQKSVKEAKSILIAGGGPVGVEFAGEVFSKYPGKSITLVSGSKNLIAGSNNVKLHNKLLSQLKKAGVKVILEDRLLLDNASTRSLSQLTKFQTKAGVEIECDFILNGFGSQPNTSLLKKLDGSVLNEGGFVKVNKDLTLESKTLSNYFAVGDINNMPGGKTYMAATGQVPALVTNIMVQINGKGKLKEASAPPNIMAVPLGTKGGAVMLPFATLGEWTVSLIKGKSLFVSNFTSTYA